MLVKLLTALFVLGAVAYWVLPLRSVIGGRSRRRGRVAPPAPPSPAPAPRVLRADDLEKCARCGIWLPAGQRCDCAGGG